MSSAIQIDLMCGPGNLPKIPQDTKRIAYYRGYFRGHAGNTWLCWAKFAGQPCVWQSPSRPIGRYLTPPNKDAVFHLRNTRQDLHKELQPIYVFLADIITCTQGRDPLVRARLLRTSGVSDIMDGIPQETINKLRVLWVLDAEGNIAECELHESCWLEAVLQARCTSVPVMRRAELQKYVALEVAKLKRERAIAKLDTRPPLTKAQLKKLSYRELAEEIHKALGTRGAGGRRIRKTKKPATGKR